MKKNMKQFLENGKHPELEAAQQERDSALPPLPERDINHSFVFLDISIGGKPAGDDVGNRNGMLLLDSALKGMDRFTMWLEHTEAYNLQRPTLVVEHT